jgi:hypothetical protein
VAADVRRRWSRDRGDMAELTQSIIDRVGLSAVADARVTSLPTGQGRLVEQAVASGQAVADGVISQADADRYEMVVANWLVVDAARRDEQAHNQDVLLRRIAKQVGVDTADIPAPTPAQLPTAVSRRDNDYRLSLGQ